MTGIDVAAIWLSDEIERQVDLVGVTRRQIP
jgi:hypothetical protein